MLANCSPSDCSTTRFLVLVVFKCFVFSFGLESLTRSRLVLDVGAPLFK